MGVIAGIPALLIILQPDLGTMLVLSATVFGVLAVAGVPRRWLVSLFLGRGHRGHAGGDRPGVLKQYQINRFMAFTDPGLDPRGAGYNTTQARIAIGNGGLFGQGLFDGSQTRSRFVPEQHTDFIFTVAGEELGLIGAGVLILLFAVLLWRALHISLHADDMFGRVAAAGIACWFAFQTFQNIGMCLGIMPVTGVPLPLVSYGGSSMFASMMAVGLLQNIAMRGSTVSRAVRPGEVASGLGQGEGEGRAALGVAARPHLATVQRDDPSGEREAEPGAGGAALLRAAVELLEDQLLLALGDPDAVVGDLDADPARLVVGLGADLHPRAAGRRRCT